jgi:hypothetical protein
MSGTASVHCNWRCRTCALHHQLRPTPSRQVLQGTAAPQAIDAAADGRRVPTGNSFTKQHGTTHSSATHTCCSNQSAQGGCAWLTRALSRADRKIGTIVTMSKKDCQLRMYLQQGSDTQVCATCAILTTGFSGVGC